MKSLALLSFVCLVAVVLESGCDAATTARPKAAVSKCGQACQDDYKPVCGKADGANAEVTYGSKCVLDKYACESGKKITQLRDGECGGKAPVRLS